MFLPNKPNLRKQTQFRGRGRVGAPSAPAAPDWGQIASREESRLACHPDLNRAEKEHPKPSGATASVGSGPSAVVRASPAGAR